MKNCEHKWVSMEDGTNDKFCVKCRKFAMQAVMSLENSTTTDRNHKGNFPSIDLREQIPKEITLQDLIKNIIIEQKKSERNVFNVK